MPKVDRYKLRYGPYSTPRFRYGQTVECAMRGPVKITGLTDAEIPWPTCRPRSSPAIIVFGALAKAVKRESASAVARAWGVTAQTVTLWRAALGVKQVNEGTFALKSELWKQEPWAKRNRRKALAKANDPARLAKLSVAHRGKKLSPEHVAKMRAANLGKKASVKTRRRMSLAHRRRGTLVPGMIPWTAAEDELCCTLPPAEVAKKTGRSVSAAYSRRIRLGMTPGGKRKRKQGVLDRQANHRRRKRA